MNAACGSPLLLGCSPRAGGNSDTAIRLFAQGFTHVAGKGANIAAAPVFLRDYRVLPCVSCGTCGTYGSASQAFGCPLSVWDDSVFLLRALYEAPLLCLAAPIYFYHLPAVLKALIDRTQSFWAIREDLLELPARTCHLILIAAREKGDRLFEGSLLTLRTAFTPLRVTLADPLLLRGLDEAGALQENSDLCGAVLRYGETAGAQYRDSLSGLRPDPESAPTHRAGA